MAGDLGLSGAYGASGAHQALRQLIADRIAAQQRQQAAQQQQFQNSIETRKLDQTDTLTRLKLQELATEKAGAEQDKQFGIGEKLNDQIPAGPIAPDSRAVGPLKMVGAIDQQPNLPSRQTSGTLRMATDAPTVAGSLSTTSIPEQYVKRASAKQLDTSADNARQDKALKQSGDLADWKLGIAQDLANVKLGAGAKEPPSSYQLQPEVDATGKQTGRFLGYNTKANRFEPVQGTTPTATKATPGAAQLAQHDVAKKEALGSLDQLDQSIDAAKDLIGPGAGRISNLQQMIGSQDPKIQALGTKMLLAKMQVDHAASGTVRAGASPQLLARWDNILANKVTPEGLKAAVQAMREILGGSAPASSGGVKVLSITPIGQ